VRARIGGRRGEGYEGRKRYEDLAPLNKNPDYAPIK